jgi:valyl-tRNA synthetase
VAPVRGVAKPQAAPESVCIAPWPQADIAWQNVAIEQQFADFQAVLGAVREIRQRQNIPPKEDLCFSVRCDAATASLLQPMQPYFAQMAKATGTAWGANATAPDISASVTLSGKTGPLEVHVDLSRFIDVAAERKRLEKERENITKQIGSIDNKLANKNFVDKAPAEVVDRERTKLAELRGQLSSVETALQKLKA